MPSAVLIFNTHSGSHLHRAEARAETVAILTAAGLEVSVLDGPLDQQIRRSLQSDADMVVAGGGDGTVRAVIAAHRGGGRPIGIVPGGTMNLLARDFAIPEDPEEAARVIAEGHTRAFDYALLDGHVFLHAALTGLPVRIGVHREQRRGRMRIVDRVALGLHALTTLPRDPELTVTGIDEEGRTVEARSPSFAFVVGRLERQLLPRPHRSDVAAGVMTLFALHPDTGLDVARLLLRGAVGQIAEDPAVDQFVVRSAEIRGPRRRMHAMLDGESRLVKSPCAVEIRSGEVSVFAPPPEPRAEEEDDAA
jgi:diacylglycerol kinase family enzyme